MIGSVGLGGGKVSSMLERTKLTREQFMNILAEELRNQNPLNPMSNTDFLNQLVGMQSLEQSSTMVEVLTTFQRHMELSFGASFLGKKISGTDETGKSVVGTVSKVQTDEGKVFLIVGGRRVPVSGVREVLLNQE